MKKVLILTVTAGNGHNSAAYAMKEKLETTGQVEVMVVDIIKEYTSKFNSSIVDKGYNFAVGKLRPIYDFFYNKYLSYKSSNAYKCPAQTSVKNVNGKLLRLIYDFEPDVIYSTSYYCGMALTNLRKVYDLPCKTIVCMLDYVVSPFWEASIGGIDYLTLSHEDFRDELIERGFRNESLIFTGIPVGEKFSKVVDKTYARDMLGLKKDLFTVLILLGGGHWKGSCSVLKNLIKSIKKDIQIIVLNGHDKKSKLKIDAEMKHYPSNIVVENVGFTEKVDLYMSASDLMIGKGGGLSTTESINKTLPLIATSKLPGQELYNIKFLEEKGLALIFKNKKQLIKIVEDLYQNPVKLQNMSLGLLQIKTNGIEGIFELIMKQPNADYDMINKKLDYKKVNRVVNKARKRKTKI